MIKKIFLIIIIILFSFNVNADIETFTTTTGYSTTNSVTWDTSILDKKTIIVNNDGSNTGTLRVRGRTTPDGKYKTLNEDTIDASDDTIIYLDYFYDQILIDVKHGDGTTDMIIETGHGGLY